MEHYQGQLLDSRYMVEEMIGQGGMGVVYRGRHLVVGRSVAIKFLSAEFSTQEEIVTRFYREAQTAAAIGHKNIIDILDVGISDRHEPYFVMEYLEGECLSALMQRTGPLQLSAALGILEPVLLAVAAAHSKGVIHRDLKPDNVFLVHDAVDNTITVKLIDFGISKFLNLDENDKLTRAGSALGTPCYMSPEQVSCSFEADHRSDIYSMGVLLFEMLTGDTPHTGTGNQETMIKILTEAPRNPSDINPDFPEAARPIIERAMAVNPIHRYQSATEMLADVRQLEAYADCQVKLSEIALGLLGKQCAVGDLGRTIGSDENSDVPAKVFSGLSEHYTPDGWTFPKSKFSRFPAGPKDRRFWGVIGGAILLMIIVFVVVIGRNQGDDEDIETLTLPIAASTSSGEQAVETATGGVHPSGHAERKEIRIEINGAPPRSTIYYDDVLVPSNKFYVPLGDKAAKLTVEAPGYAAFHTEVTPEDDLVVEVEMTPEDERGGNTSLTGGEGKRRGDYIRGRRQTEIVKDFE